VRRLGRDRLLVDVVRVVAEEARLGVVLLVRRDVLTHGDAVIDLRRWQRLRLRGVGRLHRDGDLLWLGRLRLRRLGLRRGGGRGWRCRLRRRGLRRVDRVGGRCRFLVDRRDLERLLLVADHPANAGPERRQRDLVIVEERDLIPPFAQDEVRADGGTDPEDQRGVDFTRRHAHQHSA
jgi:hypothetical protein